MAPNRPFVVDPTLSAIAIGYSNDAQTLIADRVLPRQPVAGEKFKWLEYPLGQAFSVPDTRVGRTGRVNRVEFESTEKTESVEDFGLEDPIPNSDIVEAERARAENRSSFNPETYATMMLTDLTLLDREVRVAKMIQDTNSYDAARRLALTGTDKFSDYDNSNPLEVLKEAINGTLIYRANTLVMGNKVWQTLSSHPHLVNAIRGSFTNKGIISREELARLLEIREILVGEGYVNTARKGQAPVLDRVWGNSIQALHINPIARPEGGITFGYTAEYGNRVSGRIEDPNVGLGGGTVIRVGERVKELICAKDVGYQLTGVVAD
ncbi:hypothetical protein DFR52_106239 [Hoeflea marina]|uniref:Capsid protein n=1 Tax=Hoeflea marina TaxID=274592 RepID=A0A317PFZ0_9HYPH|nr:capsid protein [Hoeflea marina]PWV97714.1 hypothetical protein DFR52_106239 [Hoeflea marina]